MPTCAYAGLIESREHWVMRANGGAEANHASPACGGPIEANYRPPLRRPDLHPIRDGAMSVKNFDIVTSACASIGSGSDRRQQEVWTPAFATHRIVNNAARRKCSYRGEQNWRDTTAPDVARTDRAEYFRGRRGRGRRNGADGGVFGGTAHAAVYVEMGPDLRSGLSDLGWKGEAKFFVPNACLSHSGLVFNAESCSNSSMSLLSASVDFYKVSDPANATFQESIFFNTPSPLVTWVLIDDGMLSGVHGSFNYLVAATLPLAGGRHQFILSFEDTIARLGCFRESPRVQRRRAHHVSAHPSRAA